jgi:hypothetical protein
MAKFKLSKEKMKEEIRKCGRDPTYFIKNYCVIQHPQRGLIPFKLYPFQEDLLGEFNAFRFNVILKSRQLGISTLSAAYIVWMMLFRREKNVLVVATKFATAGNLVKKVKKMMKNLPQWIQISKISVDNQTSFELDNGSIIKASSTSSDAGRSEALSLLVIDEAAFVAGLDEMWKAVGPTLSAGGACIALSSPNGVGNWFHKTYVDAVDQKNGFNAVKLLWDVHPERDLEWLEEQKKKYSPREMAQEYMCNFNMSGETVIDPTIIQKMKQFMKEPKFRTGWDRNYWIWENYQEGNSYLLVADVARGDGEDYSTFHIFCLESMEVVAEYQGKPEYDMFAQILASVGAEYGTCLLVVENNNLGHSVLKELKGLEYPNLYYSVKSTHKFVDAVTAEYQTGTIAGFTTSSKTRPIIIAKMEEFLRNEIVKVNSSRLIHELERFVWNNGKPEAMKGSNDDLIMAFAIGCWVRDTALQTSARETAYNEAMLDAMILSNTKIATVIPGMIGYNRKLDNHNMRLDEAKRQHLEFGWVLKG